MIVTRQAINATYESNNIVSTMIYAVLINHVGDDMTHHDVERHIKVNCYDQAKGTHLEASRLLKIVKEHVAKHQ